MKWFKRDRPSLDPPEDRSSRVPEGMWIKCISCREIIYRKEIERKFFVCPKCNYHFRIGMRQRLRLLADEGSFVPYGGNLTALDPLGFKDSKKYRERIREASRKTGETEAVLTGRATMDGRKVQLCIFNFDFMGGSMGSVVGERLTRAIEAAVAEGTPLVTVSCSGGARMQEGLFSLMQMAKTSAALTVMERARLPYISVLSDPTTGGVSASFAMLGDVIVAEPRALIGFAGPRVIKQTIGEDLPDDFQRAEFLLEHGLLDMVVDRNKLKKTIVSLIDFFAG
jgi:acetyl-CoA carboxylase carboxyl transferase subunit beta